MKSRIFSQLLCAGLLGCAITSQAEVVFDGTIGPNAAGISDSGNFFITEADGEVRGNNLFHSFERFNVQSGESATFVHSSTNVDNIIARVTGMTPTNINGVLGTAFFDGVNLFFTEAALWLLNPNGILIGDGAEFDSLGAINLSTANRLGFDNGDDFYTHELSIASTLSVAEPTSFGFLDRQALPANVTPAGIRVQINDPANLNAPLFLNDLYLIGSSDDPDTPAVSIRGDINGRFVEDAALLDDSSEIQFLNLALIGLGQSADGQGSSVNVFDLSTSAITGPAADIQIENAALSLNSSLPFPETTLQIYGENLSVSNSQLQALAVRQATPMTLYANAAINLFDSELTSINTDATAASGGDINLDASAILLLNSSLLARDFDLFGQAGIRGGGGSINIGLNRAPEDLSIEAGSSVATIGLFELAAGDIRIAAENLFVGGGTSDINVASTNGGLGGSGNISLDIGSELFIAGTEEAGVTVSSQNFAGGDPGDIAINANRIDTNFLEVFSAGRVESDGRPSINIRGGLDGILMTNGAVTNASTAIPEFSGADINIQSLGDISIASARGNFNIQSIAAGDRNAGRVAIQADGDLLLFGGVRIDNNTLGDVDSTGQAEGIFLSGANVTIDASTGVVDPNGVIAQINSSTSTAADAAGISIVASEQLLLDGQVGVASQSTGRGDAGNIALTGNSVFIENASESGLALLNTESRGSGGAGQIQVNSQTQLTVSGRTAITSETFADGDAGQILFSSTSMLLEGEELFVSSRAGRGTSGDAGRIDLAATENIVINDISQITTQSLGAGGPGNVRLTGDTIIIVETRISNATSSPVASADVGELELIAEDELLLGNTEVIANAGGFATTGGVILQAGSDITIDETTIQSGTSDEDNFGAFAGDININSGGVLFLSGEGTNVLTNASADSDGGNINVIADSVLMFNQALLQTASDRGLAGDINLDARDIEIFSKNIDAFSEQGGGGNVNILASERLALNPAAGIFAFSESSTAGGNGGSINLGSEQQPIPLLLIRGTAVSARAVAGNGGQINVYADAFMRDADSSMTVSSVSGEPGALEINSPEQDISAAITDLNVGLLDVSSLIQSACAVLDSDQSSSSLTLDGQGGLAMAPDDYLVSTNPAVAEAGSSLIAIDIGAQFGRSTLSGLCGHSLL